MKGGKMKQLLESLQGFRPSSARLHHFVERETRLELATLALARRCSTTELLPLEHKGFYRPNLCCQAGGFRDGGVNPLWVSQGLSEHAGGGSGL